MKTATTQLISVWNGFAGVSDGLNPVVASARSRSPLRLPLRRRVSPVVCVFFLAEGSQST